MAARMRVRFLSDSYALEGTLWGRWRGRGRHVYITTPNRTHSTFGSPSPFVPSRPVPVTTCRCIYHKSSSFIAIAVFPRHLCIIICCQVLPCLARARRLPTGPTPPRAMSPKVAKAPKGAPKASRAGLKRKWTDCDEAKVGCAFFAAGTA